MSYVSCFLVNFLFFPGTMPSRGWACRQRRRAVFSSDRFREQVGKNCCGDRAFVLGNKIYSTKYEK